AAARPLARGRPFRHRRRHRPEGDARGDRRDAGAMPAAQAAARAVAETARHLANLRRHGMGRILLLRHGQASLMEDDYDRLSPLGHKQGEVAGRWLAARLGTPQLVVTGTLQRQRDTAAACIAAAGWAA